MAARGSAAIPWDDRDVLRLSMTTAIGFAAIAAAWFFSSGSASTGTQALWLNIGVAGSVVAGLGNCVWLLRGRRAVGERRADLVSLGPAASSVTPIRTSVSDTLTMPLGVVRAEGMRKVHRPDCPLVVGKRLEPANPGDGDSCGVCAP